MKERDAQVEYKKRKREMLKDRDQYYVEKAKEAKQSEFSSRNNIVAYLGLRIGFVGGAGEGKAEKRSSTSCVWFSKETVRRANKGREL